jgi:hypothetical protein
MNIQEKYDLKINDIVFTNLDYVKTKPYFLIGKIYYISSSKIALKIISQGENKYQTFKDFKTRFIPFIKSPYEPSTWSLASNIEEKDNKDLYFKKITISKNVYNKLYNAY